MAGYVPGQQPANRSQEKEFVQAYEDVLERYKDERDRVQKKTFTKWVNKHLMKVRKHINDLYEDLRDGHNLISLLEVLSGIKLEPAGLKTLRLPREKGRMRFHRLQNVQIALDFLKQRQVKLVNIRNDDITDGNPKLTLGLIWTIILHFQVGPAQFGVPVAWFGRGLERTRGCSAFLPHPEPSFSVFECD
uniref:Microtubule actin crosslinking factor 1 n=1 Tax=Sus scrofa TaxID=9823 RepID=A0A8D1X7Y4_PIG